MERAFSHTLANGRAGLPALLDALECHLHDAGVPTAAASAVMVAADEVLSNVIDYSGATSIQVAAAAGEGRVEVQVVDDGAAFDPTARAAPDTRLPIEEREVGGLGIHLLGELMDEVTYERVGEANRLSFSKAYDVVSPSRRSGGES